jgi:hypothetical protein
LPKEQYSLPVAPAVEPNSTTDTSSYAASDMASDISSVSNI